jgi:pyruvate dehydrogenase E1 component beta subunit
MTELKMWQAVNTALTEELERDPSVIVFGEDVGKPGGPFGASRGLRDRFGANRVLDTPISEATIVGAAVGAAMCGLRPVVEVMYFDFLTLGMDQLVNQAAKMRYMSAGQESVPMVVRTMCGAGRGSGPQHSQSLEGWVAQVPGLQVVYPSTSADAKGLLKSAIRSDDPVVFIESARLWTQRSEVPDGEHLVPIGQGNIRRSGRDVTLVAWGWAIERTLAAAEELATEGIEAEVVDLRSINPLDETLLLSSLERTGHLLVVHDASGPFGPGAEIAALACGPGYAYLRAPVERVTPPFAPAPFSHHLEEAFYPHTKRIVAATHRVLEYRSHD